MNDAEQSQLSTIAQAIASAKAPEDWEAILEEAGSISDNSVEFYDLLPLIRIALNRKDLKMAEERLRRAGKFAEYLNRALNERAV